MENSCVLTMISEEAALTAGVMTAWIKYSCSDVPLLPLPLLLCWAITTSTAAWATRVCHFSPHTQTHMHSKLTVGPSTSAYLSILICIYSLNVTELWLAARLKNTERSIWREGRPRTALLFLAHITFASINITGCQQKLAAMETWTDKHVMRKPLMSSWPKLSALSAVVSYNVHRERKFSVMGKMRVSLKMDSCCCYEYWGWSMCVESREDMFQEDK